MSYKQICVCEKGNFKSNKHNLETCPPTTIDDISFLFRPNSTTIEQDTNTPIISHSDEGYENFKRQLLRTRQRFKIRGLSGKTTQTQTLEQVLCQVQQQIKQTDDLEAKQLILISGHLVPNGKSKRSRRDIVMQKIEERNKAFLEWIVPAIYRQLNELRLSSSKTQLCRQVE